MRRPLARSGPGSSSFSASRATTQRQDADYIVNKVVNLRVFADEDGKFNLSAMDVGRRPSPHQPVHPPRRHPQGPPSELRPGRGTRPRTVAVRSDRREVSRDRPSRRNGRLPSLHDGLADQRRPRHHHDRLRRQGTPPQGLASHSGDHLVIPAKAGIQNPQLRDLCALCGESPILRGTTPTPCRAVRG